MRAAISEESSRTLPRSYHFVGAARTDAEGSIAKAGHIFVRSEIARAAWTSEAQGNANGVLRFRVRSSRKRRGLCYPKG
ncbi:MAG: hypothetical protein ACREOW_00315 [Thermodesulfobacteriota bacterium]